MFVNSTGEVALKNKVAIFDIDGTISDCTHRVPYAKVADWDNFNRAAYLDLPHEPIVVILNSVYVQGAKIILMSGRPHWMYNMTRDWLERHKIPFHNIHLRLPEQEAWHTCDAKREMFRQSGIRVSDVLFVMEDREKDVMMWRELGLTCLQVAYNPY